VTRRGHELRSHIAAQSCRVGQLLADGYGARVLRLVALILPLALDTFAVSAALGIGGLSPTERLRVSLLLAGFEAGMPLIGVGLGHALGEEIGSAGGYLASASLVTLGAFVLLTGDDDADKTATLARTHGLALIAIGISIGLDELAVGFSVGLLDLPLAWTIVLIAAQAFVAAQIGMRLGARIGAQARERVEQAAGLALIALGITFLLTRAASV
jgi:manganese efflux pump family protein